MRLIIPIFLVLVLAAIGFSFFNLGFHKSVNLSTGTRGPFFLIFKIHVGPYHEIGDMLAEIEKLAQSEGLDCGTTFGEYLDDPAKIDHDRLRANGGCVLNQEPAKIPKGLELKVLPEQKYIVAEFSGSPLIGPMKVYPKLFDLAAQNNITKFSPIYELYRMPQVTYLVPFAAD